MNTVPRQKLTFILATALITAAVATGTANAAPQPLTPAAPAPIATGGSGSSGSSTGSVTAADLTRLGTLALCLVGIVRNSPDCAWL